MVFLCLLFEVEGQWKVLRFKMSRKILGDEENVKIGLNRECMIYLSKLIGGVNCAATGSMIYLSKWIGGVNCAATGSMIYLSTWIGGVNCAATGSMIYLSKWIGGVNCAATGSMIYLSKWIGGVNCAATGSMSIQSPTLVGNTARFKILLILSNYPFNGCLIFFPYSNVNEKHCFQAMTMQIYIR